MKEVEFKEKVKEFGLEKVSHVARLEPFLTKSKNIYIDKTALHMYVCYKNKEEQYVIFYKDGERGITTELGKFKKEEEAYERLFGIIEKAYNKR